MSLSWAEPALKALEFLKAAGQAAERREWATAIRLAWLAETEAANFARALEKARVEADELKRG